MLATEPNLLTLACGPLELQLEPPLGGSIARFHYRTASGDKIQCLHEVEGKAASLLDHGSIPLVPFSNRIRCR